MPENGPEYNFLRRQKYKYSARTVDALQETYCGLRRHQISMAAHSIPFQFLIPDIVGFSLELNGNMLARFASAKPADL